MMSRSKKRVLINVLMLQNHLGGIGWYSFHLAKQLAHQYPDVEFTMLTHSGVSFSFYSLKPSVVIREVKLRSSLLRSLYQQLVVPFICLQYSLLHSAGNIGVVFCPIKQIITIHDTYEKVSPERFGILKRVLMGWLIGLSGFRAQKIIAVSNNTKTDIGRFYPVLFNKTDVVYSGNRFTAGAQTLPEKIKSRLLFVGTIEPGKNLITALKALRIINQTRCADLLVVGAAGWKCSDIPALIAGLDIGDHVVFSGYISDNELQNAYRSSHALLFPSSYEGFGFPVIEAMINQCVVIAADNSSIREAGGDAAVYFKTFNERDLAEKIVLTYSEEFDYAAQVTRGLAHAEKFTWESTALRTYACYQ